MKNNNHDKIIKILDKTNYQSYIVEVINVGDEARTVEILNGLGRLLSDIKKVERERDLNYSIVLLKRKALTALATLRTFNRGLDIDLKSII